MSKQQRHEQRKVERVRRRSAFRNGSAALAAAAAIAAGTQAYANPIRFDNPAGAGHFVWTASPGHEVLDIEQNAAGQPGVLHGVGTFEVASFYGRVARGGASSGLQHMAPDGYRFLAGVDSGVAIPTPGFAGFTSASQNAYIFSTYPYAPVTSLLPEGQQTYLGLRFDQGAGFQYGWIGVVRTGMEVDAFAWGYETTPGVAIPAGVPEPGTLALLAFGAAATLRRRS
jgi:hypothetical protein